MNYEEKYKNALDRARKELQECVHKDCDDMTRRTAITIIKNLFPELKESEDDRIKREILDYINELANLKNEKIHTEWLDWLEKQGEKDPCIGCSNDKGCVTCENGNLKEIKVEPKFKEGDYIVPYNITPLEIWKVINIDDDGYYNIQPITNIINTEDDEIYRVPAFALEKDYYNLDNFKKKN